MRLLGICDVTSTFWPICETMVTRKPGTLGCVFPTQNNKAKQRLLGGCALMEMSNRTNNVAPNLFRERNQLHSSMHPSMLFIRVSVLLNSHSTPTHTHTYARAHPHTHTSCVATGPTHTCTRYKVAPHNRRVEISGAEGGIRGGGGGRGLKAWD